MGKELAIQSLYGALDSITLLLKPAYLLDDQTAILAWSILDALEKELIESRKKELRIRLFEIAEASGKTNSNDSYVYEGDDGVKVIKERRKGKVFIFIGKLWDKFRDTELANDLFKHTVDMNPEQYGWFKKLLTAESLEDYSAISENIRCLIGELSLVSESAFEMMVRKGKIGVQDLSEVTEVAEPTFALNVKKPSKIVDLLKVLKEK